MVTSVGRLVVIPPHGDIIDNRISKSPTLKELQNLVGGYIQSLPEFDKYEDMPAEAWVNEDGLAIGLPLNNRAITLWRSILTPKGPFRADMTNIVGNCVIIVGKRFFLR